MKFTRTYWLKLVLVGVATGIGSLLYLSLSKPQLMYAARRCWNAAPHWYSCYFDKNFEFTTDLFGMHYEGNASNYIDGQILSNGAYEKHVLFFLGEVMQAGSPNGVFVDVGANTGQYSLFMSRYSREVHAFEPYPPVLKRFNRNVEINRIQNIKIYPVGLGSQKAKIPFYKPPDSNLGSGSFLGTFDSKNTNYGELEIVVGDDALNSVNSVDLVKIDVEGYEKEVLQGLKRTLAKNRPVVACELAIRPTESFSFKSKEELLKAFPENYRIVSFDMSNFDLFTGFYQLVELDQDLRFDRAAFYEIVAYPAEKEGQIPRRGPR